MTVLRGLVRLAVVLLALTTGAVAVSAQTTTGTVAGSVRNAKSGPVSGATVVLIDEARGVRSLPVRTNRDGDYVFPNIAPGAYVVEVTGTGFRTLSGPVVAVSLGARVAVPALTLVAGGATETAKVSLEAPVLQAASSERSFIIANTQIQYLPLIGSRNFAALAGLGPGSATTTRLGGGGQSNILMDGVSVLDTGDNSQMFEMNVESVGEVTVLSQGYQAEFGRSSGLQIMAATRSGTNRIRGSLYDLEDNSDWNANSWAREKNGEAKEEFRASTLGYTVGGPIGRPGGNNKLFFFYSHEYRPTTTGGAISRFRVPTEAERRGDFSQSLDSQGRLFNTIRDPNLAGACSATDTTACFADGGVLGRIPQDRLYSVGVNILSRYPTANRTQAPGTNYNLEIPRPEDKNLLQQPAVRVDYLLRPGLRITGRFASQLESRRVIPGTMPGFNDVLAPNPFTFTYGVTVNYALNPTTFVEATYGSSRNELAVGGIPVNASATLASPGLEGLPSLVPESGKISEPRSYTYQVMREETPVFWDPATSRMLVPPSFTWGSRIGSQPPNQQFPASLSYIKNRDFSASLTKVAARHTIKLGFFNQIGRRDENVVAGGAGGLSPFGLIDFGNNTNNPLDTGFGFSNAAVGVFNQYLQQEAFTESSKVYRNTEMFAQDNFRFGDRLTFDLGVRVTHQEPQHDQFYQSANFFPNLWSAALAPLLYVPGCSDGAVTCSGDTLNAMHPITHEILTIPGIAHTQAAIGSVVPNSGDSLNGIRRARDGIDGTAYTWPGFVYAPRVGVVYDVKGTEQLIVRGGAGVFFDRPGGYTVSPLRANYPLTATQELRSGSLDTLEKLDVDGVLTLNSFEYLSTVPSSIQWNGGVQMVLPWASTLDVSYVGQRGFDRLGPINLNAVDIGAGYLEENQDATKAPTSVPGQNALPANLLRSLTGLGAIQQQTATFYDEYHSIQSSFVRRLRNGLAFGVQYTLGLVFNGTTGLTERLDHAADGSTQLRSDQAEYENLNKQLNLKRHVLRGHAVWDLPDLETDTGARRVLGYLLNDWRISGVLTAGSGDRYDLTYRYNSAGEAVNLTGSPDYQARMRIVGDPGTGCSDNPYAQFNVNAVTGPVYRSTGLESGRNYLVGCPDKTLDLSFSRDIRVGGSRLITVRLDTFNAFNVAVINARQTEAQYDNPTDRTLLNSQTLPGGAVDPTRVTPDNAGFGAATGAQAMRSVRLGLRFSF